MSADYTACSGEGCPIKKSCHRFTGPKSNYQSTFIEPPMEIADGWFYCEEFWDNKPKKQLEQFIKRDFERYKGLSKFSRL